jgi:small subunit ribosomal protein S8
MSWSDPIADMLTRIRNSQSAGAESVEMPHSKLKGEIVRLMKREGYINDFSVEGNVKKTLRVFLKYSGDGEPAIRGLRRDSLTGRRLYAGRNAIPRVLGGMGVTLVSTSQGVLTGKEARKRGIGGELICSIW